LNLLEAKNLHFSYGDHPVLRDISLHLAPGEIVALLGPNGSGKSTLLRALLGQLRATGDIQWEGRSVHSWSRRDLARRVAYLPQSPAADPEQRVVDVLRTGRAPYWGPFGIESARDVEVVEQVAEQTGLTDLLQRPIAELSGGQRQLVFLARCLVQQPGALLLDEPNTFLDLKHQVELAQLLKRLARERHIAVLLTSHDINLAATLADRLILLNQGEIAADGPPAPTLDPELFSRVYGIPLGRIDGRPSTLPVLLPRIMLQ
jgi:iron complex transport system ATP-binding protein